MGLPVVGAWLSFPLAYYVFGMLLMALCPWCLEYYLGSVPGLRIPGPATVLAVQLLRGGLFLVVTWPVIATWSGTRLSLAVKLGLAYTVLVGLFGLVQAPWMPFNMRVAHGLEIMADSFAHAALLVVLLVPPRAGREGANR